MMGHLNSFSASGGGNLNKFFPKIQMPGGLPGGMLKLRFDWYITTTSPALHLKIRPSSQLAQVTKISYFSYHSKCVMEAIWWQNSRV